ncbi:MAG: hypothetical protein H0T15_05945 [Thermoleophilaceae bacterium]|nr:hypothetical protein [Thermoleophilaceae bacterium]
MPPAWLWLAQFLERKPDLPDRSLGTDPTGYLLIFGLGFLVATIGHIVKSKTMVAIGIALVMAATVIAPLVFALGEG